MTTAVNYDTVTTAASDIRRMAGDINRETHDLLGQIKAVTGDWDGDAKTAYLEIQASVVRNLGGLNEQLQILASKLDQAVVGYQDTDKGNAARFRMMH
ncbi:WXG100 family type VII secretion target [Streptomyces sp. NPDC020681]|uniref:WXG100 family type VII secretion target n=1 Tax=Streptomyces sp. NPDC020681 TaxID=3365083 RepID=UPI003792E9EA